MYHCWTEMSFDLFAKRRTCSGLTIPNVYGLFQVISVTIQSYHYRFYHLYMFSERYGLGLLQIDHSDNFDATFSQVFLTFHIQNGKFITGPYWTAYPMTWNILDLKIRNSRLTIQDFWSHRITSIQHFWCHWITTIFLPLISGT